jgi:hypothetical protein
MIADFVISNSKIILTFVAWAHIYLGKVLNSLSGDRSVLVLNKLKNVSYD